MWTTDTQLARGSTGAAVPWRLGPLGDERLARLIAGGNERAFTALYHRYHQRIYRYCRSLLHNDADAQDALQATFANAYTALARGHRDAPMRPWLYRIAHNESITLLRRRKPETALSEAHEPWTASAVEVADERARLALLVADLGELSERQRGALVMRELSGLSHEEIALAFGISVGSAKQTIFEARQSLAEFAQGRATACEDICRAISNGNGRVMRGRKVRAHLRDCGLCAAFAASIGGRSRDLRAIAPPLSAGAAASLLRHSIGGASAQGGSGTGAGVVTGAAGKAAAVAVTVKTVAAAAAVATTAVGLTGIIQHLDRHSAGTPVTAAAASRSGADAGASATTTQAGHVTLASVSRTDRRRRAGGAAAGGGGSQTAGHPRVAVTRRGLAGSGASGGGARSGSPTAIRSDGSHGAVATGGTGTVSGVEQGNADSAGKANANGANNGNAYGHGTGKGASTTTKPGEAKGKADGANNGNADGAGEANGAATGNAKGKGAATGNAKGKGAATGNAKAKGAASGNREAKGAVNGNGNANGATAASPTGATTTPGSDGDGSATGAGGTTSPGNGVGRANGDGTANGAGDGNGKGNGATNGNGHNK